MAWKLYIKYTNYDIPVPGTFKTKEEAELFYRRNKTAFTVAAEAGKPIIVEQGKGRGKK